MLAISFPPLVTKVIRDRLFSLAASMADILMQTKDILTQLMRILSMWLVVINCLYLLGVNCTTAGAFSSAKGVDQEVYIVYLGHHGGLHPDEVIGSHHMMLSSVKGSIDDAMQALLYSYKHSFSGFSALLTEEEAARLAGMEGVLSIFRSQHRKMHTTRSWDFLGMDDHSAMPEPLANNKQLPRRASSKTLRERANNGTDIVIGVLDSGIWPESESFKDDGMAPIPSTWHGTCEVGDSFNSSHCNRKVIGARMYIKQYEQRYGPLDVKKTGEYRSARDKDGHGTHTASTAGGREVKGAAALGGFGAGTAIGGAPLARLAIYKVCWPMPKESTAGDNTCGDADMLAAFDDALADGVDVISVSIGSHNPQPSFLEDAIAIGSLHAVRHGVLVACSGGNDGPMGASVANVAPWIVTVGASSMDRLFSAPLTLGNGKTYQGETVTAFTLKQNFYPLIHSAEALHENISLPKLNPLAASQCLEGTLDPKKVRGKIVFCLRGTNFRVAKGAEVRRAKGAGMILANGPANGVEISVDSHVLPATAVVADVGKDILQYLRTTRNPTAKLSRPRTDLGVRPSPFIAGFSSQGPNSLVPEILKPDISAPGLNILAAWTAENAPTKLAFDKRRVNYNIYSGTSMSCPHVSGTAALLRAIHPSWSPAAVKSAMMTTSYVVDTDNMSISAASGENANPFQMGSGELNPAMAARPGLVYDAYFDDYLQFLCSIGYKQRSIARMVGPVSNSRLCRQSNLNPRDLNLPSVTIDMRSSHGDVVVERKVTNVGDRSVYRVSIEQPRGALVSIKPSKLAFTRSSQTGAFKIRVSLAGREARAPLHSFGSFTWADEHGHKVRSPIILQI